MHTLSSRAAIAPLISVLLMLLPSPFNDRVDANEFPSQPAPQRQSPAAQPLRKPDAIQDRTRATELRVVRTPDVVGQAVGNAKAKLESAGLRGGPEIAEATRGARPGTVVRQSPAAGTPIKPGAAISLWVAAAPPGDGRRPDDVGSPITPGTPPRGDGGIRLPEGPRFVVVPDLGRRSVSEALTMLERARLRVGTQRREESDAPPDTVVGQLPAAGQRVLVGTPVNITVATPILVTVPDLRGRSSREAAAELEQSRLRAGGIRREESQATAGEILSQAPAAGARVPVGTAVSVIIATPVLVEVPDVLGRGLAEAVEQLERSRLGLGRQQSEESEAVAGTVVSQTPVAGRRVPVGSSIAITVASPILVSVPDLSGRTDDEARPLLRDRQLVLGERQRQESDAKPGSITRQSPRADARVPRGTRIDVVVAEAPPIAPVVLPPSPPPLPRPEVTQPSPQKPPEVARSPRPTPNPVAPGLVSPVRPVPPVSAVPPVPPTPVPSTPPVTPESPAPVASATPVIPPPASSPARGFDWLFVVALSAALVLILGGARVTLRRHSARRTPSSSSVPVPTLDFTPHWDVGTTRIGPAGALCAGSGLRLVSGMEMDSTHLDNEHIMDVVHAAGESR